MSETRPARSPRFGEFVALVALLLSVVALAIDTMLPALPAIGRDLEAARPNDVQLVVTTLFLGLAGGQLLCGPLSDRFGRKPVICLGLGVFMAGCVVSLLAGSFGTMLAGRFLQGIGAAAPRVVTLALVRDRYAGRPMARLMSFAMGAFILVPTVAPALGQGILALGGWRAIFGVFLLVAAAALVWLALRQPETLPPGRRRPFTWRAVAGPVGAILGNRAVVGYTLATGFVFSPFIAYLSSAQQVFQEAYRTGARFPLYFAVLSLAIGAASVGNGRLVMRYGMRRLSTIAAAAASLVSFAAWAGALAWDGLPPLGLFMLYLTVVFVCLGLLFGNLNALAMAPLGRMAGVGAAVVASLSTLISVPLGALVARGFDGAVYFQIGAFAVFSAATLAAIRAVPASDGGPNPET